ncbi:MAG: hypothetical protein D6698_12465, partial [Gammaproteobacteria bacterium]
AGNQTIDLPQPIDNVTLPKITPLVKRNIKEYASLTDDDLLKEFYELRSARHSWNSYNRRRNQAELDAVVLLCLKRNLLKWWLVTGRFSYSGGGFSTQIAAPDEKRAIDWAFSSSEISYASLQAFEMPIAFLLADLEEKKGKGGKGKKGEKDDS